MENQAVDLYFFSPIKWSSQKIGLDLYLVGNEVHLDRNRMRIQVNSKLLTGLSKSPLDSFESLDPLIQIHSQCCFFGFSGIMPGMSLVLLSLFIVLRQASITELICGNHVRNKTFQSVWLLRVLLSLDM